MDNATNFIPYGGHDSIPLFPVRGPQTSHEVGNATNLNSYRVHDTTPLFPVRGPQTPQDFHASQLPHQAADSSEKYLLPNRSMWYFEPHNTPKRKILPSWLAERLPKGWRLGATLAVILSTLVLFINIAVAGLAAVRMRRNGSKFTVSPIAVGSCETLEHASLIVHLAINVASSLLLSGSNFCMQCISAPTRRDIDKAHEKGKWLDIAVPSMRNILSLGPKRLFLWLSLGLSSIPLHLVYNSTFFLSTTHNSAYRLLFASENFVDGASFSDLFLSGGDNVVAQYPNGTLYNTTLGSSSSLSTNLSSIPTIQANSRQFQRLENADCISAYAKRILPERSNLILVTSTSPHDEVAFESAFGNRCQTPGAEVIIPSSSMDYSRDIATEYAVCDERSSLFAATPISNSFTDDDPFYWICASRQTRYAASDDQEESCGLVYETMLDNAANWTVSGFRVDYCLSEEKESQCTLNVALSLLVAVIAFNLLKVGAIAYTLRVLRDKPLITIGDAVDSFLVQSDPFTSGNRLLTKEGVVMKVDDDALTPSKFVDPYTLTDDKARWWKAASKRRWSVALTLIFTALAAILGLLALAIMALRSSKVISFEAVWQLGLGNTDPRAFITGWDVPDTGNRATIASIVVANSPHLVLSLIYIMLNGIITSMSLAVEWSQYAHKPRTLRVTQQKGEQRSTYFLQVPFRLGVPVMIFSMIIHWLISQSIFLAKIDDSEDVSNNVTTCGFSPAGIISTFFAGVLLIVFAVVLGSRRLIPGMPLVGSCSLAISAACHAPKGTSEARPLIWGPLPQSRHDNNPLVGPYGFHNEISE